MGRIQPQLPLNRLAGRTLGVVGFGQIARALVPRARAFGLRVKATSRSLTAEQAREAGAERAALNDLLATSDFVSVHCPLTDDTRGLIGRDALGRMKPTAFLINTSRGPVVDEAALAEALESGTIAGAALDVRCQEPPPAGDRLISMPNVIHTPHAAFYSAESLAELQEKAAMEARRVLSGQRPVHLVNGVGA
jgi:D-3-phosphoglycerate dehydrogenase